MHSASRTIEQWQSASTPGCPSSVALVSASLRWWDLRCSAGARACCRVSKGGGPPAGLTLSLGAIWDAAAASVSNSDTWRGVGNSLHSQQAHTLEFVNVMTKIDAKHMTMSTLLLGFWEKLPTCTWLKHTIPDNHFVLFAQV